MVLNMADFVNSWKSLQTLWNACKTVVKWFVTACGTVCVDLRSIRKGQKFANFEQKAWAIAHGFEHGRFCQLLEIAPNSLKRLQNRSKMICDCLRDCLWVKNSPARSIRKGRKLADFEQKAWAIAHGFEHGRFFQLLEIAPNSLKRLQNRSKMICDCWRDCLFRFTVNSQGSKIGRFEQKAWAIAHGFEHGRFCQLLEIAPNSLKRLQNRCKMICDCLHDCLCRFSVNS